MELEGPPSSWDSVARVLSDQKVVMCDCVRAPIGRKNTWSSTRPFVDGVRASIYTAQWAF